MEEEVMFHSSSFLLPSIPADEASAYAIIVLNQKLPRFTPLLWEHAKLRLCADGGANRIYDELPLFFPHEDALLIRNRYKPDVIKGDMDSIRPDVLHFYLSLGTKVIDESHDQDTTDLDKCILYICNSALNQEIGDDERALRLRPAGMQALAFMVSFIGEHSQLSMALDMIMCVILENYMDLEKGREDITNEAGEDSETKSPSMSKWVSFKRNNHVTEENISNNLLGVFLHRVQ